MPFLTARTRTADITVGANCKGKSTTQAPQIIYMQYKLYTYIYLVLTIGQNYASTDQSPISNKIKKK